MKALSRTSASCIAALALGLFVSACREVPVETLQPETPIVQPTDTLHVIPGIRLLAAECRASVRQVKVECGAPSVVAGISPDLIVGGQNQYVELTSSNVSYVGTAFTFNVALRNLIPQPMGTTNDATLAPDPAGIKIFFQTAPTVTDGEGTITVVSDGTGTFTNADQHYYQYNNVLERFEVSAPKTWQFNIPATVNTFAFTVLVSAPVPWPDGYIDVTGAQEMRYDARQFAATVRTAVGNPVPGTPITWSSSDTTLAMVDAAGLATPKRAGLVRVIANAVLNGMPVTGDTTSVVRPIRRMWTGAAGTTSWTDNNNWIPAIAPTATDTAVVTDSVATLFPVLTQNQQIGGLFVEYRSVGPLPTVDIGPFDLTASGDVLAGTGTSVTGSSGRLTLSGTARTVGGTFPRVRVTGTYSLVANLTVKAPLRSELGRIRNDKFRIRAVSQ